MMANAKEKILLKQRSDVYEVMSLENRMFPLIGEILNQREVNDLLIEAKRPYGNLLVKIS